MHYRNEMMELPLFDSKLSALKFLTKLPPFVRSFVRTSPPCSKMNKHVEMLSICLTKQQNTSVFRAVRICTAQVEYRAYINDN